MRTSSSDLPVQITHASTIPKDSEISRRFMPLLPRYSEGYCPDEILTSAATQRDEADEPQSSRRERSPALIAVDLARAGVDNDERLPLGQQFDQPWQQDQGMPVAIRAGEAVSLVIAALPSETLESVVELRADIG